MDTRYDILSNLGLWFEYHFELHPGENELVFGYSGLDDPMRIKEHLARQLNEIVLSNSFVSAKGRAPKNSQYEKDSCHIHEKNGMHKGKLPLSLLFETLFLTCASSLLSG
jgi:hypothetical protein